MIVNRETTISKILLNFNYHFKGVLSKFGDRHRKTAGV